MSRCCWASYGGAGSLARSAMAWISALHGLAQDRAGSAPMPLERGTQQALGEWICLERLAKRCIGHIEASKHCTETASGTRAAFVLVRLEDTPVSVRLEWRAARHDTFNCYSHRRVRRPGMLETLTQLIGEGRPNVCSSSAASTLEVAKRRSSCSSTSTKASVTVVSKGGGGGGSLKVSVSRPPCFGTPATPNSSSSPKGFLAPSPPDGGRARDFIIRLGTPVIASNLALMAPAVSVSGATTCRVGPKAACIERGSATLTRVGGTPGSTTFKCTVPPLATPAIPKLIASSDRVTPSRRSLRSWSTGS
eukprot:scaffold123058_cov72-Phaeocystis_antarctica.AAC.4